MTPHHSPNTNVIYVTLEVHLGGIPGQRKHRVLLTGRYGGICYTYKLFSVLFNFLEIKTIYQYMT